MILIKIIFIEHCDTCFLFFLLFMQGWLLCECALRGGSEIVTEMISKIWTSSLHDSRRWYRTEMNKREL